MTRPVVQPPTPWHFPEPTTTRLPNGLEVWAFDLPGQHVAALELVLPSALALEPRHVEGVATVALHATDEGTRAHPAGRISELLELEGAVLHGSAVQGHTQLGGDAPARRLPRTMELFTEVVTTPDYADDDVAHHVELQVAAFESRLASPGHVAKQAFRTALYGDAAREGRPSAGTPETLGAITRDDVVAWHAQRWSPQHATLVLAGDLGASSIADVVAPLAAWEGRDVPRPAEATARAPQLVVVDMPEAVQATLQAGSLTVGRADPDWAALKLAGHAMGGAFASRLNLELRERRGYTYGVGGGFSARRRDGQFHVGGSFRVEVAGDAVAHLLEALALAEPFTVAEIADAQAYLVGVAPLANETAADIAKQAAVLAAAGVAPGFVNEHFAALAASDADAATAAFRRHVSPDALTIALSGPADVLEPALRAAGLDPVVV